jgi:cytoskeletal protein CcmA (bactofilin family)
MAFGKKDQLVRPAENHSVTAVIEQGCEFEGKLTFEGTVRIGGRFKGEIYSRDTLVVSEGASVEGDVQVGTAIINGEFTGNLKAVDRAEIHRPAVFKGDIDTPSLQVDEGVIFEGEAKMSGDRLQAEDIL